MLISIIVAMLLTVACAATQSMSPSEAQELLVHAWNADQHVIWEIDWPAAPIGGPLTVEVWRAGQRYRFEILEAVAPALVGETLVFDGEHAWRYNRFEPPLAFTPASPSLSPVSDAFAIIDGLINELPATARQEAVQNSYRSAQKVTLTYASGDTLTFWRDDETDLAVRIIFSVEGRQAKLEARDAEPLLDPPAELFGVGDWLGG